MSMTRILGSYITKDYTRSGDGVGYRSSHWQMIFKIGVLKNFPIFTGKHLPATLFKRDSKADIFLGILRNF